MIIEILHFLLMPIIWLPIVIILGILTYRNYKKINQLKVLNVDSVLLMLEIPKTNDKQELSAEQMFASLHGILRDSESLKGSGGVQEHLSFEVVSTGGQIRFYVWTPKTLQSFVEGQIYAQYPTVQIYTIDHDYVDNREKHEVIYTAELGLTENTALPIKTFESFEVDPLAGITGTLAKLDSDHSSSILILPGFCRLFPPSGLHPLAVLPLTLRSNFPNELKPRLALPNKRPPNLDMRLKSV